MDDVRSFRVAVFPGDGIGIEVTDAAIRVLRETERHTGGYRLVLQKLPAGAFCYKETGEALPKESLDEAAKSDAILLGACGWPGIRYPDGTEIRPQLELRFLFDLYAGVRPIRCFAGARRVLSDPRSKEIDFVIIRESTEGLFASRGSRKNPEAAVETMLITREKTERLMRFSYRITRERRKRGHRGRLTCVDKANVFSAFAFFREIYDRIGTEFPDVERDYSYVDAAALGMVLRPWEYDVMVMENMFGDILSDLGAGLIGGMGMAPSADIGEEHAVFQPSHGTAPDIAGKGIANPVAMILSAAMMCRHLAERHKERKLEETSLLIEKAVESYFASGQNLPVDQGGTASTEEVTDLIIQSMEAVKGSSPAAPPLQGR